MAFWSHFVERLPGVLGVKPGHGWSLGHSASLPACDATRRGEKRRVDGAAGVLDREVTCRKTAADAYGWGEAPVGLTVLTGTATWNPANIGGGGRDFTTVTVTGAAVGDPAACGMTTNTDTILGCLATVTAANTCTAVLHNLTTGTASDIGSGTVRCTVLKH